MSYCRKCGSKLEENAKFCPACGTPVETQPVSAPPSARVAPRRGWSPIYTLAIVLGAILFVALIVGVLIFVPVRTVSFNQLEQVPFESGLSAADLSLSADVATYNITFGNLNGQVMIMNVSANGGVGLLAPSDPLSFTVDHSRTGNTIFIDARVSRTGGWWPFFGGLSPVCNVRIDRSLNLTLKVTNTVGRTLMIAPAGVIFDSLDLETTTGQVEASLKRNVIVNGDILVQSTTGTTDFSWDNVEITENVSVNVKTTTGTVSVNVTQQNLMFGNVTLKAETVTGSVNLQMAIHDGVGASISSSATTGGINTDLTRFSGQKSLLYSDNYPAPSNFNVTLRTTTGGININATYLPSGQT